MGPRARVSSSRRSVVELLCWSALTALVAPALGGCREKAVGGPRLRVRTSANSAPSAPVPALWLALATLEPARQKSFLDALDSSLVSAEARGNPLLVDLLDEDPRDVVSRAKPWLLPLCTAASALLAMRASSADGLSVEVLPRNAAVTSDDVAAWGNSTDEASRRARFLAWPVSRALVVRAASADASKNVDGALRLSALDPAGATALSLSAGVLRGDADPAVGETLRRLSRAAGHSGTTEEAALSATLPEKGSDLAPWISLAENERLVVPKLGALGPRGRFESEVTRIAAARGASIVAGAPRAAG